jgi:hypothetical protein
MNRWRRGPQLLRIDIDGVLKARRDESAAQSVLAWPLTRSLA